MPKLFLTSAFVVCALLLAACGNNPPPPASRENTNAAANSAPPGGSAGVNTSGVGVVPSHGSASGASTAGGSTAPDKAPVETPELDSKIEKALAKAKAPGASASEKKAAADAYMARGNFYYSAGDPRLYRYALGDFRRALRFDPGNEEATAKVKQIEDIYTYSVHKPIPNNGLDEP